MLIFAGLSPFTIEGESRGSRTEYIHWIQDVPDQKQIVSQYCRYTGEIKSAKNVKQMVGRALQFAMSDPKGPVYLMGAREVMEEEITPYELNKEHWDPVVPIALHQPAVRNIGLALLEATAPLVITGYSGRLPEAPTKLVQLVNAIPGLRVLDTAGSDMCFPADHPAYLGLRYGVDDSIRTADVILVIDCDVPWINTQCHPNARAKIFHIDVDPLKQQMPVFYLNAIARYKAQSGVALEQLNEFIAMQRRDSSELMEARFEDRAQKMRASYEERLASVAEFKRPASDGRFSSSCLTAAVRRAVPKDTIFIIEAVTNTVFVADQIQATIPHSWFNCGGGGLGWSGGAALGVKLATKDMEEDRFVCQIVGDGTFLFSVPGSVYWISQRYKVPVLTIVLNNKGIHMVLSFYSTF